MKVRVFRLESQHSISGYDYGQGPFYTGIVNNYFPEGFHSEEHGFPAPQNDDIPWDWWLRAGQWVCGCASVKQLLTWFPSKAVRALREDEEFGIAVYEVDDYHVNYGFRQLIFNAEKAERVYFK